MSETNQPGSQRYTTDLYSSRSAIYHPGVVQVVPHYDIGHPTNAVNVIYFSTTASGLTTAQLAGVRDAFDGQWVTQWKIGAGSNQKYLGSVVTDVSSATGLQAGNTTYSPVSGLGSSAEAPDNCALLLSLKTATRYKGGHGRIYIPGLSATQVQADGWHWSSTQVGYMVTAWNNVVNALAALAGAGGGPYNPIVWHKKLAAAPNTIENVIGVTGQTIIASQRRRLRKVPHH